MGQSPTTAMDRLSNTQYLLRVASADLHSQIDRCREEWQQAVNAGLADDRRAMRLLEALQPDLRLLADRLREADLTICRMRRDLTPPPINKLR